MDLELQGFPSGNECVGQLPLPTVNNFSMKGDIAVLVGDFN